jgi:hypothetical protein
VGLRRGAVGSALVSSIFFRILLLTKLQTDFKPFREIFAQPITAFQPLQRYQISEFLVPFFMILFKIFKPFAINNLSTLKLLIFSTALIVS